MSELSKETKVQMVDTIIRSGMNLIYKPYYNKYKCYCQMCGKTYTVTKDQFKEIRNSHMCPECWREVSKIEAAEPIRLIDYVSVPDGFNSSGYQIEFTWFFNRASKIRTTLVAKFYNITGKYGDRQEPDYTEVRGIHIGPFGSGIYPDTIGYKAKWRHKTKTPSYFRSMYEIGNPFNGSMAMNRDIDFAFHGGKRAYLNAVIGRYHPKSSQMQIAIKHILKPIQLQRMVMFDLNDYAIVKTMKFRKYGFYSSDPYDPAYVTSCMEYHLNKFDAIYIRDNCIDVADYLDYLSDCEKLKIKNKHPHDFQAEHAKLAKIIRERRDAMKQAGANKILAKLAKMLPEYHGKEYVIQPIRSTSELKKNADYMQNCIYSYLDNYLDQRCFLYIVRSNEGKILANVELHKDKIVQIRARYNNEPPKSIQKTVQQMVAKNSEKLQHIPYLEVTV